MQVISGLQNFDEKNVASVVSAAEQVSISNLKSESDGFQVIWRLLSLCIVEHFILSYIWCFVFKTFKHS